MKSALNRRRFLASGLAGALCAISGSSVSAALAGGMFSRPLAGSSVVSSFASCLFLFEDQMPLALRRAIDTELDGIDVTPGKFADERPRAEFFAWLAVRCIVPLNLRRAGYDALAVDCQNQNDLWNASLASAGAQHTIGKEHRGCRLMPRLAGSAYGACAHAATAAFYARAEEIETVTETGHYCARALLQSIGDEDADVTEALWIWDFAVSVINTAAGLGAVETK